MKNEDGIPILLKAQVITKMTDEQIASAASIAQWILDSVKTGKIKNEITIAKILAGMVMYSRKKKGYTIKQLAKATFQTNDTIERIENGKSIVWEQYLDCIEKLDKPFLFKEELMITNASHATMDNTKVQRLQKNYGFFAKKILQFTIHNSQIKVATGLKKKGIDAKTVLLITNGKVVNLQPYHIVIRYCLRILTNDRSFWYKQWKMEGVSYVEFDAMTKDLPGNRAKLSDYKAFFEYIKKVLETTTKNANLLTPKNNFSSEKCFLIKTIITSKRKHEEITAESISQEGNAIRWSTYTSNSDFDYGLADT